MCTHTCVRMVGHAQALTHSRTSGHFVGANAITGVILRPAVQA